MATILKLAYTHTSIPPLLFNYPTCFPLQLNSSVSEVLYLIGFQ